MLKSTGMQELRALSALHHWPHKDALVRWLASSRDSLREYIEMRDEDRPTERGAARLLTELLMEIELAPARANEARRNHMFDSEEPAEGIGA